MSSPFSPVQVISQPIYTTTVPPNGMFSPFPTVGLGYQEVGYGQGGYGQGGYDTPTLPIQPTSTPIWTIGSAR
jgi:hypothetical protein